VLALLTSSADPGVELAEAPDPEPLPSEALIAVEAISLNRGEIKALANKPPGSLTGWDLAGQEAAYPDPLLHGRSFEVARENGLRITIHAGEWGGAAQVRRALIVDPERIAHGPGAIEDAALCAELTARGVTLDMAPTSNWQGASVPSVAEHPIGPLYRMGVPVTLNTDDLTVSDLKLSEEYIKASEQIGLSLPDLWAIDRHALDAAFIDETTRDRLRAEFDLWASNVPELAGPGG